MNGIKGEDKMKNLVSIIVPVYNVEKYLNRCIKSLLNQTYKNIEIILVDDGSTDNSGRLCDEYKSKDSRVSVIHKSNAGLGMARNSGIDVAMGKYLTFVDSDDYIELKAIANLVDLAQNYDAEIVTSQFIYENIIEKTEIKTGIYNGKNEVLELLAHMVGNHLSKHDQLNVSSCTKLYFTELIRKNNIRFLSEKEIIWEDLAFNVDVFTHCKKIYVSDYAYYHYCYNGNSLTHRYNPKKFSQVMTMYDYIIRKLTSLKMHQDVFVRVNNMFMGNIRTCMKLEAFYVKENGKKKVIDNIKSMCEDIRLQKLVYDVPNTEMTKQQLIYSFFIKRKWPVALYYLAVLQNKRKKNLIN